MVFDENQPSFGQFVRLLNEAPGSFVFCVGTGVTAAGVARWAGKPECDPTKWAGLIHNGISKIAEKDELLATKLTEQMDVKQSGPTTYSECAAAIRKTLGDQEYGAWLASCFSGLSVAEQRADVHRLLASALLRGARVMTTNYDTLITDYLDQPDFVPITSSSPGLTIQFAVGNEGTKRGVFHVHGVYRDQASIVLTDDEYAAAQADEERRQALINLLQNNHLVFIGCGGTLEDKNVGNSLAWTSSFLKNWGKSCFFVGFQNDLDRLVATGMPLNGITTQCISVPSNEAGHPELLGFGAATLSALKTEPFHRFKITEVPGALRPYANDTVDDKPSVTEVSQLPPPPCEDAVREKLNLDRVVHVRGRPASGKTLLGVRLAVEAESRGQAAYWWRITAALDEEPAWQARMGYLKALLHLHNSFVVIDEAHVDQKRIAQLIEVANVCASGKLLILSTGGFMPDALKFRTDSAFFAAVSIFIANRLGKNIQVADDEAEAWFALFGGRTVDLVRALLGKLPTSEPDRSLALSKEDVVEWMRARLSDINEASIPGRILAQMICLAQIELSGKKQPFWVVPTFLGIADADDATMQPLLNTGLVVDRDTPTGKQYRLANPDHDAEIMQRASYITDDQVAAAKLPAIRLALLRHPFVGRQFARALAPTDSAALAVSFDDWAEHCAEATVGRVPFSTAPLIEWLNDHNPATARRTVELMKDNPWWAEDQLDRAPSLIGAGKMAAAIWHAGRCPDDPTVSRFDDFADHLATAAIRRADIARDLWCGSETIDSFAKLFRQSRSATHDQRKAMLDAVAGQGQSELARWVHGSTTSDANGRTFYNRFSFGNLLFETAFYQDQKSAGHARASLGPVGQQLLASMAHQRMDLPYEINRNNVGSSPVQTASAMIQLAGSLGIYDQVNDLYKHLSILRANLVSEITQFVVTHRLNGRNESMPLDYIVPVATVDTKTAEIFAIEQRQLRHWYGLHVWSGVTDRPVNLPHGIFDQTLNLMLNRIELSRRSGVERFPQAHKALCTIADWVSGAQDGRLRPPDRTIGEMMDCWKESL